MAFEPLASLYEVGKIQVDDEWDALHRLQARFDQSEAKILGHRRYALWKAMLGPKFVMPSGPFR